MHWLAEQGLALKRVFLVIIPLLIFIVSEIVKISFGHKESVHMKSNKFNTAAVQNVLLYVVNILGGNVAGGALLTNALYGLRFVGMIDESKDRRFN